MQARANRILRRSRCGGIHRETFGDGVGAGIRKLALRTLLRLRGSFANHNVSLEQGPIDLKLATSFLLALANPLAALIPLIDLVTSTMPGALSPAAWAQCSESFSLCSPAH